MQACTQISHSFMHTWLLFVLRVALESAKVLLLTSAQSPQRLSLVSSLLNCCYDWTLGEPFLSCTPLAIQNISSFQLTCRPSCS